MNLYARLQNKVNFDLFWKYESSVKSTGTNPIFNEFLDTFVVMETLR